MKFAAICCTYKRPELLSQVIECFLRQDYPAHLRELIILDDAGQYGNVSGDGWKIVSTTQRFRTMGEKRNASAALVSADVDAYCVWDDDDIYLPWHMSVCAKTLAHCDYAIPSLLYMEEKIKMTKQMNTEFYHGAWAFTRAAFDTAGGYPFIQSGQDQGLLKRFKHHNLKHGDQLHYDERPSYIYRWYTVHEYHLSVMGKDGYQRYEEVNAPKVERLVPSWDRDWVAVCKTLEKKYD